MHDRLIVKHPFWAYTHNQRQGRIIAAQHFCGVDGHAINARLDDADNWYCPRCHEIYAAAEQMCVLPFHSPGVAIAREHADEQ